MYRVFLFGIRYNGVFAFIILQIIALSFYFTRNVNSNKLVFLSSCNGLMGNVYERFNQIASYWNLSEVNEKLAKENAILKMKLPDAKFSALVNVKNKVDSTLGQRYQYIEGKVLNNTTHRPHNFITINRGSSHDIQKNMGIINAQGNGLVGIIRKSSSNFSVASSILNLDTKISAKIISTKNFGTLSWDGVYSDRMKLNAIPKHVKIHIGDTIVTSGYSTIFPENILVGTIDTFYKPPGINYYNIEVKLFNDISTTEYIYIVKNFLKEEQKAIELEFYE